MGKRLPATDSTGQIGSIANVDAFPVLPTSYFGRPNGSAAKQSARPRTLGVPTGYFYRGRESLEVVALMGLKKAQIKSLAWRPVVSAVGQASLRTRLAAWKAYPPWGIAGAPLRRTRLNRRPSSAQMIPKGIIRTIRLIPEFAILVRTARLLRTIRSRTGAKRNRPDSVGAV